MKKLSTWLIIIGIIIICLPLAGKLYLHYEQQKLYEAYQSSLSADIMDEEFIDGVPAYEGEEPPENKEKQSIDGVIGKLEIPSISVDLLLLEGSSGRELRYGAGRVTSTSLPGQIGNCAIAGHRDYTFGTYFSRLDEVKNGDLITVDYQGTVYQYEVYDSFVVEPTEVSVLEPTEQAVLTLITCTPRGKSTHRLIVRAQLVANERGS